MLFLKIKTPIYTLRLITLKMGVLDVKNVKKHTYLAFSQFATFSNPEAQRF